MFKVLTKHLFVWFENKTEDKAKNIFKAQSIFAMRVGEEVGEANLKKNQVFFSFLASLNVC